VRSAVHCMRTHQSACILFVNISTLLYRECKGVQMLLTAFLAESTGMAGERQGVSAFVLSAVPASFILCRQH
jgi:hypothetical protein